MNNDNQILCLLFFIVGFATATFFVCLVFFPSKLETSKEKYYIRTVACINTFSKYNEDLSKNILFIKCLKNEDLLKE